MSIFIENKEVVETVIKEKGSLGQNLRVLLYIDHSVSIKRLFDNGTIQQFVEKVIPIGLALDSDGKIEVFIFDDVVNKLPEDATIDNYIGYVERHTEDVDYGGTRYSTVIQSAIKETGATQTIQVTYMKSAKRGGLMGLFGKAKPTETKQTIYIHPSGKTKIPTLALVLTDGDCDDADKYLAKRLIMESSTHPICYMILGVQGNPKPDFKFVKELDVEEGRFIDNVEFAELTIEAIMNLPAKEFYSLILGGVLTKWLPAAKEQFLIK